MKWSARVRSHPRAPLWVVLTGTSMIVLDFFIVNVMLPSIHAHLHAGPGAIEWVVAGYGLPFAVLLITAGRLGDRFGRRRMFSSGIVVFTLASAACGLAWSPTALVVARVVQGVGAALISPNVLSIIGVVYTGEERVRALRSYGLVLGLAAVGGQLIGGLLVHADLAGLGWRTCFLINVPIGVATLAVARSLVPESRDERPGRIDLVGMVLATVGLIAIVLPLVEGRQHGWPTWAWLSLALAPILLVALAAQQRALGRRGGAPLLDPRLFRQRAFSAGLLTQAWFWCGQASFFLVLALYLQEGRGLGALQAGLVFTILAVAYLATSMTAPALTRRHGRRLIAIGALVVAGGHVLLLLAVWQIGITGAIALLAPGLVLVGAGMGLCITPLTTTVMAGLDPRQAGAASGPLSTMQQVGNSLGVAVTGLIFFGGLGHGFGGAFEASVAELAVVGLGVALLSRLLPAVAGAPKPSAGRLLSRVPVPAK